MIYSKMSQSIIEWDLEWSSSILWTKQTSMHEQDLYVTRWCNWATSDTKFKNGNEVINPSSCEPTILETCHEDYMKQLCTSLEMNSSFICYQEEKPNLINQKLV